jgi:hypothetical protein
MFGGCELRRPTLARQLLAAGRAGAGPLQIGRRVVITLFGATEIKSPTLAEEFIDLREAVQSNALDIRQWDSYLAELDRWQNSALVSFTMFGAFEETTLPSEDDEIEGLALQRHLGNISDSSGRVLELGIGQGGAQRRSVIHQAVMVA